MPICQVPGMMYGSKPTDGGNFILTEEEKSRILGMHQSNQTKKYLIEIKPYKQTLPPIKPSRQTKKYLYEAYEYAKNQAKWKVAKEFCEDRQWEFKVLTEKELNIK